MSLVIETLKDAADAAAASNSVIVNRRLFVTADRSRAVEEGDPDAAFLLCAPGKPVLRSELERLGVQIDGGEKKGGGEKRDKAPAEDKAQGPADNKGGGAGVPGNVKTAKAAIAEADDAEALDAFDELEAAREGGPRTGVTKALAKRRADLES